MSGKKQSPLIIANQYAQQAEKKQPSPQTTPPQPTPPPQSMYCILILSFLFYSNHYIFLAFLQKVLVHTTLIRDGQGLGFFIAGGKGSPPFKVLFLSIIY